MTNKFKKNLLFVALLFISQVVFCQEDFKVDAFKVFNFRCNSGNDSITLPDNCVGPKYYNYEEGWIVYFVSSDTITINILCGGDAILSFNKIYVETDKIMNDGKVMSIRYYDKVNDKYARKDYLLNSEISYEGATKDKKYEYDMLFNMYTEDRRRK